MSFILTIFDESLGNEVTQTGLEVANRTQAWIDTFGEAIIGINETSRKFLYAMYDSIGQYATKI